MRTRSPSSFGAVPARPQALAGLLDLDHLDQLLEREPEQVAQAHHLAQAGDIALGVEAMAALGPIGVAAQQSDLLVVADRARGDADGARHLADAVRGFALAGGLECPVFHHETPSVVENLNVYVKSRYGHRRL